jgi:hypothetical protein
LARIGARTGKSAQFSPFDLEENDIKRRMLEIEREQNKIKLGYQDQIAGVEDQVESLKEVKDELTDQTKKYEDIIGYQKKMIGLWDEFHKAAGGGGGGGGTEGLAGKLGLTGPGGLEEKIAESKAKMEGAWAGFEQKLAPFNKALEILERGLPNPFADMLTDMRDIAKEVDKITFGLTGKHLFFSNDTGTDDIFGKERPGADEHERRLRDMYNRRYADESKWDNLPGSENYSDDGGSSGAGSKLPPDVQKVRDISKEAGRSIQFFKDMLDWLTPVFDFSGKVFVGMLDDFYDKGSVVVNLV